MLYVHLFLKPRFKTPRVPHFLSRRLRNLISEFSRSAVQITVSKPSCVESRSTSRALVGLAGSWTLTLVRGTRCKLSSFTVRGGMCLVHSFMIMNISGKMFCALISFRYIVYPYGWENTAVVYGYPGVIVGKKQTCHMNVPIQTGN